MLTAFEGRITALRQLTPTGFAEVTLEDTTGAIYRAAGSELLVLRKGDLLVAIGKEEIKPKFGPQTRLIRWWQKDRCPFSDLKSAKDNIAFLYEKLQVPPAIAQKIFDAYLHETMNVIKDNPYRIATEGRVRGVGIATIDKHIAPHFEIKPTDRRRLKAQIISTLKSIRSMYGVQPFVDESTGESHGVAGGGHAYIDFTQLVGTTSEEMSLSRKVASEEIRRMAKEPRHPLSDKPLLVIENDEQSVEKYVYPHALHVAEKGLAFHVRRIRAMATPDFSQLDIASPGLTLSPEQEAAIRMALTHPLSIITGGPGTGKTTIIKALTSTLEANYITFSLAAPTGVASRRMVKATGKVATTIHRLLAVDPIKGSFTHHRDNPLPTQVVICDESSMTDLPLMYSLFDAIAHGTRLILVGDADQLPPVGPGSPFRDMVGWGKIPTTRLTQIRRQELGDSMIIQGSRDILAEKMPTFSKEPPNGDLYAFPYTNETNAIKIVVDLVTDKIPKTFGIPLENIQVLCPHRRMKKKEKDGVESIGKMLASENINLILQEKFFGKPERGDRFFLGDRVIQTKNNYNLDVMNGEIGYIRGIDTKEYRGIKKSSYVVEFEEEKRIAYSDKDAYHLQLAYALSVHKSQGSEFSAVVILAYHSGNFFSRNMLYTALTRGKRVVIIVSPKGAVSFAKILKTKETPRSSRLTWRIENEHDDDTTLGQLDLDELSDGDEA